MGDDDNSFCKKIEICKVATQNHVVFIFILYYYRAKLIMVNTCQYHYSNVI